MKKQMYWLSFVMLAGWALSAHAQDVWTYQMVGPNDQSKVTFQPPKDLTYPPAGMPMPISYSTENRGVVLTPREAQARRNSPQLVIMLIPAAIAERSRFAATLDPTVLQTR